MFNAWLLRILWKTFTLMFKEFPNVIYLIPFFFDMGKKEVADSKKSIENK